MSGDAGGRGTPERARVRVHVQPRAARDAIGPWQAGRLEIRTTAPPVDGRANDAVCRLLAEALGIAPSRLTVVRGRRGREKAVQVAGLPVSEVLRRLNYPGSPGR